MSSSITSNRPAGRHARSLSTCTIGWPNKACGAKATQTVLPYVVVNRSGSIEMGAVQVCDEHARKYSDREVDRVAWWYVPGSPVGQAVEVRVLSTPRRRAEQPERHLQVVSA